MLASRLFSVPHPSLPRARIRLAGVLVAAFVVTGASYAMTVVTSHRPGAVAPAAAGAAAAGSAAAADLGAPDGLAAPVDPSIARLDAAIAVWTANLDADHADWLSAQNLSTVEYTRGRLTGSVDDYQRADEAARLALSIYPDDLGAQAIHGVLLQSLHAFPEALALARTIYAAHPDQLQALATMADAQLETGDYDGAARSLAVLETKSPGAAITARLAHLAALRGDGAGAKTLAARSIDEAREAGSDGTALAWYEQLAGTLAFQDGRLADAEVSFRAALADWPGSYAALEGLGKTLAAEGHLSDAVAMLERAVAIVPQPQYLAELGDLYQLTGQTAKAEQERATVGLTGRLAAIEKQVYNRQLVLFDANHGLDPSTAVQLAQAEIASRKDVYGWDALAWALLADGQAGQADRAMTHALAMHTRDALLEYHAGMIAAALGDSAGARLHLSAALSINPGFDPLQSRRARATLATLP